ncbi:MFS transporter [Halarcobacter sp.]|uniref:MFS transporter n=1 Tax=Halarcobacter sp. TaxID=2321133 RepID=UPI0029F55119|nr:MFS transporter [Halarcobacter sp.]
MQKTNTKIGFFASTISFLMVFAASATPIPLYDIYRQEDGLTYNDLALTAVVYFVGAITALLIFGRISNHLGRKPVAFLIFALTAIATIILFDVDSATPLIIGRFLLGLACGLASSAITSYIADSASFLPHWVPSAVISNSPMTGLTIGAIVSGSLVEFGPYPRVLCYIVVLIVLAICTILIAISKETVDKTPGIISSFKPKFSLPQADKRLFPIAAVTFVSTWAMGAFYQAFGPSVAVDQLGTHSTLMIGILFSSYLLPSAIGGPLTAKLTPANAQRIGMVMFTIGVIGIITSLKFSSITMFLACSALAGASQGAALTGSIRSLLADVDIKERAGILSLIYAVSYTGAAVPSFISGQLSHHMDLFHVSIFYGIIAIVACFITLIFAKNPKHAEAELEL